MVRELTTADPGFAAAFAAFLAEPRGGAEDVEAAVARIVDDVREGGDEALLACVARFDGVHLAPEDLRVPADALAAAAARVPAEVREALALAGRRIADYHRRQMPADSRYRDPSGIELGARWTPIAAVGMYVPGGTAAYPSSVLMNAVPPGT